MKEIEIVNSPLEGCRGIIIGEKYEDCFVIEFTYVPKNYFQLPCTQVIAKKYVKILGLCSDGIKPAT